MAVRWAAVMRGGRKPLSVAVTSRIDDAAGELVPTPTCAQTAMGTQASAKKYDFTAIRYNYKLVQLPLA